MSWVRRVSSWLLALFLLLLLLSLLTLYLAPGIALWWADRWYQSQGEGYQIAAADWHFSPFKGELSLQQLELRHPGHSLGEVTVLDQLLLRYELASLWQQHVHIRELALNGVQAELRIDNEQLQLAGLVLPVTASEAAPVEPKDTTTTEPQWRISVDRWQLNQHQLGWHSQLPANNQGQLTLSLSGQDVQWPLQGPLSHSVRLQLHSFELEQQLSAQFELKVDGQLSADLSHWQGQLQLEKLALNSPLAPPLSLQDLQLQDISWQQMSQTLALAQIALTNLQLGTEPQPLMSLPSYQVADVELTPAQLNSGWHEFEGLELWLDIDKDGQIKALTQANNDSSDTLEPTIEPTTKTVAETTDKTTAETSNDVAEQATQQSPDDSSHSLKLLVAGIRQGDQPSVIHVRDASVAPAFKTDITLQSLQVSPINVQQQLLTQALKLQLMLALDEYNQIDIKGELGSYQAEQAIYPQGDLVVSVSQLNLVPLNGYLSRAMGYHASRGQLNVDANLGFKQGTLQGDVALLLRNARFEPEDEAVIDRVSKQIAMPVDTALSLLRDDSGNIRLNVPLSGDLSDPDVGLNDLGRQLASLALRTATMHYLKQSLVPYGTLLSIADFAGSQLMAIRLDALILDGEQQALNTTQQQQLDKVIGIMQNKTELELKVCPQFAKENAPENWSELANLRAQWVKQYLAASKDEKQQPLSARVTLCKPELADQHQIVLGF